MSYQILLSPQVKESVIISNKYGIYQLVHELLNNLKLLRILGNQEISGRSQNFIELQPSPQPSSQNKNYLDTSKKLMKKKKLNFSHSALFHTKTIMSEIFCPWLQLSYEIVHYGKSSISIFQKIFASTDKIFNSGRG